MSDPKSEPTGTPVPVTDAFFKWEVEAARSPDSLPEIRLDANERFLVPFTTSVVTVQTHFLDLPGHWGYVRCNGPDCVLCRVGRKQDSRDLLPVYDVIAKSVGVLPVSPSVLTESLKSQLLPALRQLKADKRVLIAVRKLDRTGFSVALLDLPEGADDGASEIARFLEAHAGGTVELARIYRQLSNQELAAIPEIATSMRLKGVSA